MSVAQTTAVRSRKVGGARRRRRKWPLVVLGTPVLCFFGIVSFFYWSTRGVVFTKSGDVPVEPVAIVFGAGLHNGKPSLILRDRLDGSIELYRQGKVKKILMSGDNRARNYNEPAAMRRYALGQGVPNADILLDYAGRDTYDTCYRARNVFGLTSAVLVTQAYHAPRAVYLARAMGIDAVAYAVPNLDQFPSLQLGYTGREYLADAKAFWDLNFSHRKPYVESSKT
jgi:vancomycin permeability regulator SanA